MSRFFCLAYGIGCHALFLATYLYMAGFVGGFVVPRSIDSPATGTLTKALAVNAALLLAFALQHSVMARPAFKRWWTKFVPEPLERSTYVLFSCIALIVLMWQWRPLGGVIWNVESPTLRVACHALFAVGWAMVPAVSLLINHFDLFGTRQVWLHFQGRDYSPLKFRTPGVYARIRHPLYVGWTIAFWATPTMTAGHFVFAVLLTGYMLAAIPLEERDLIASFGDVYRDYRRRVPALLPRFAVLSRGGLKHRELADDASTTITAQGV